MKRIIGPKAVLYLGGMDLFATQVINRLPQRIQWTLVARDGARTEPMTQAGARLSIALVCASQERKASVPPSNSDFEKAYKAQFGLPPGPYALAAFDAVASLVETFGRLGTSDPALVLEHLKSGGPFSGGEGPVAFDSLGDNTLALAYIDQAERGTLVYKKTLR